MMKRMKKFHKNHQGFTLVELMIVVAIIGILAAIAIPQFAAYRIRGYNASAQSDVRNLNTSQAALFADWQRYGITQTNAGVYAPALPGGAVGALCLGADASGDGIATSDTSGVARGIQIAVGNGVLAVASVNVAPTNAVAPTAFGGLAKHTQGDTTFGVDSDSTSVYQNPTVLGVGNALTVATLTTVGITSNADDFAAIATWIKK